jgi:hypothetical protein
VKSWQSATAAPPRRDVQAARAIAPTSCALIAAGCRSSRARASPTIVRRRRKSCVCEAVARDADPIDLPRRNSPIDIDRNLSACLHPARASRVRIIIRICTDTKINAVVKP